MKIIRQGDVVLKQVTHKLNGQSKQHAQLTLQLGEATGHHHTLYPINNGAVINTLSETDTPSWIEEYTDNNERFIVLDTEWLLRHQEHHEIRIPPGTYKIEIEEEYDPYAKSMKKVID